MKLQEINLVRSNSVNSVFTRDSFSNGNTLFDFSRVCQFDLSSETVTAVPKTSTLKSDPLEDNYRSDYLKSLGKTLEIKILLIENDDPSRSSLSKMLGDRGIKVIEAKDSNTGIELAQSQVPDLIICELMMPRIDGYGIMYFLRHSILTKKIPLLFITTHQEQTEFGSEIILVERGKVELVTAVKLFEAISRKLPWWTQVRV